MDGVGRHLQTEIDRLLENFPAVAIVGARQTGKSTLASLLRPDWPFYDLENPNHFARITEDPVLFFREHPERLILDEAQRYPKLFEVLRTVIDQQRDNKGRFILTGSASFELLSTISESLAGRVAIVELSPFTMSECISEPLSDFFQIFTSPIQTHTIELLRELTASKSIQTIKKYLWAGGYPEPVLSNRTDFHLDWMENYFTTYINRDMRALYPRIDMLKYRRVVSMLAQLSGTVINRSEIARSIEVSEKTVRDYLEIITGTYFWRELPAFKTAKIKTTLKLAKGHFVDSGLALFLQNVHSLEQLNIFPQLGRAFEAFVVEELIRGVQCTPAKNLQYMHFRTKAGAEIDLILQGSFGLVPIAIKYQSYTSKRQITALMQFVERHDLPLGIVLNNCEEPSLITQNIIQVPVGCL